jgi:hypothetical protein
VKLCWQAAAAFAECGATAATPATAASTAVATPAVRHRPREERISLFTLQFP